MANTANAIYSAALGTLGGAIGWGMHHPVVARAAIDGAIQSLSAVARGPFVHARGPTWGENWAHVLANTTPSGWYVFTAFTVVTASILYVTFERLDAEGRAVAVAKPVAVTNVQGIIRLSMAGLLVMSAATVTTTVSSYFTSTPRVWLWATYATYIAAVWYRLGLTSLLRSSGLRKKLNDVHTQAQRLAALVKPYELTDAHFNRRVFVGMTEGKWKPIPVYLPPELVRKNHISLIGASGTGKTKLIGLILGQMLHEGDATVVFDPKDDEFLAGVLFLQAKKLDRPVIFINLREGIPQINPFSGTSLAERELLLQSALQLDPSGDPAVDFHRAEDREACGTLVGTDQKNIMDYVASGASMKEVTGRTNFWRALRDLARLKAFHTNEGPDLAAVIQAGGLIYVVGDTDDLRVMAAQRLLLTRVLQIIKQRERQGATQVSLLLDEFKYMISNSALRALGTIRDRRCNLLLAYQSYGDLADCGALPPKAVLGAARGNTTLKFVFKLEDAATAAEFSSIAGAESITVDTTGKTLQDGLETGQWREANRQAVTVDMLTTCMPKPMAGQASVAWIFGLGPAFPIATMHLPAGSAPTVKEAVGLPPVDVDRLDANASISVSNARDGLSPIAGAGGII